MKLSEHPYRSQPEKAYWSKAVSVKHPLDIDQWYEPKFEIGRKPIATAGSCFAQHIGRVLRNSGYRFLDVEPAPDFLPAELHEEFGYGMYSARYGNVYSSRQLLQLIKQALGEFSPEESSWNLGQGVVDPFRPTIESEPFANEAEMRASRIHHLNRVAELFSRVKVFVFTLGLTEVWASRQDGAVFPLCPGTAGGSFDGGRHHLLNLTVRDVVQDLVEFIHRVRGINRGVKILLTVSPVPLVATATANHVVVATQYSKSVLRAAAGELCQRFAFCDYFPSYEIISSPPLRGQFYNPDMRTVSNFGVEHVMRQFLKAHPALSAGPTAKQDLAGATIDAMKIHCDEELLSGFGPA